MEKLLKTTSKTIPHLLTKSYPFESHFFKIPSDSKGPKDHTLHYLDEGEGSPFLMLHGNPTWSFYYRNLVHAFKDRYRVVVPDHLGCGLSDKPQNYAYHLENHIQNTYHLIQHLDLKNIKLVVHDWGGAIGMGLMTRFPELFDRVVILNTAAFLSSHIPFRINVLRKNFMGEWLMRRLNLFAYPATFMATTRGLSKEVKKGLLYPYDNWRNRIAIARFVQDIPMEKNHPSYEFLQEIENNLSQLNHPKLILWGADDFCFHKAFYDRWRSIYPKAKARLIENCGHYILEDALDEVVKEMEGFIDS